MFLLKIEEKDDIVIGIALSKESRSCPETFLTAKIEGIRCVRNMRDWWEREKGLWFPGLFVKRFDGFDESDGMENSIRRKDGTYLT